MRSVVVVLPASTCAMIPMLRTRDSGTVRVEALCTACSRGTSAAGHERDARSAPEVRRGGRRHELSGLDHAPRPGMPLPSEPRVGIRFVRSRLLGWVPWGSLPAVVRERLVGVRHLVDVLALLDRVAAILGGVDDLVGEAVHHGLLVAVARVLDQPAHAERERAIRADIDRDLVRGATDAAALDLDAWPDVGQRAVPDLQRVVL